MNGLVFGGFGAIGEAVFATMERDGFSVLRTSSSREPWEGVLHVDVATDDGMSAIDTLPMLDAVVWAQGTTCEDTVADFDDALLRDVMEANVFFVAFTLRRLLGSGRLKDRARLCVVSSIWQEQSRPARFSYSTSKAAVGGLVRSAAIDLAERGMLINAVEPGVVDSSMSARPGSSAATFSAWSAHHRTLAAQEVAETIAHLVSPRNTAITGQSIAVDLGSLTSCMPVQAGS